MAETMRAPERGLTNLFPYEHTPLPVSERRSSGALLAILAVALVLRLAWIAYTPAIPVSDFLEYDRLGLSLAEGGGYLAGGKPTAYLSPGYPLFLAGVYRVFGHSIGAVQVLQALLGVLTVYLTYRLTSRAFTTQAGLLGAGLIAGLPSLVLYTGILASENLAIPLMLGAFDAYQAALEKRSAVARLAAAGLLTGLAALARPTMLLIPALWLIHSKFVQKMPWSRLAYVSVVVGLFTLLPVAPWSMRNYIVFERFIPISTNSSFALLVGVKGSGYAGSLDGVECLACEQGARLGWDEYQLSRAVAQEARAYLLSHPLEVAVKVPLKMYYLLRDDVSAVSWTYSGAAESPPDWLFWLLRAAAQGYYMILLGLALGSLRFFKQLMRYPGAALLALLLLYWLMLHMVVIGIDRYHLPMLPFIAAFAAFTLYKWVLPPRDAVSGSPAQVLEKEIDFHNQWAGSTRLDQILVRECFESPLAPENRFALQLMGDLRGKTVLDLGTGLGEAAVYFSLQGARVYALDVSLRMVSLAMQLAADYRTALVGLVCQAEHLGLPDNSVDVCFTANVLHHVYDRSQVLREIHRVLKPGGLVVSWDPLAYNPLINIYRRIATNVRTVDEMPLRFDAFEDFKSVFTECGHREFWLLGLLIFVKYYIWDRVHPNQQRYWKRILKEDLSTLRWLLPLMRIDTWLTRLPGLKAMAWTILMYGRKGSAK